MTTRSARRRLAVALVAIVPLAVAGLFIGSLSDVAKGVERVPAAIVNQDEIVQQKAADGTESPVLAGRLLVTQLTSDDNQAFDWTITNADEAQRMLDDGEVYAVLTVPKDFSSSIVSLSTDAPKRAEISVKTDDAHGYLTGAATQAVGVGMTSVFGNAITSQFVSGIYTTFGGLKGSLTDAGAGADKLADGATQLSAGATTLGDGITQLGDGVGQSQQGASKLADGLGTYTGGVSQLSSGLDRLQTGAAGLSQVSDGVGQYAGGAGQIAAQVAGLRQQLAANPQSAPIAAQLEPLEQGLDQYAAQGQALATQAAAGIQGVQQGIGQSASGASRLAANGGALVTGARQLSDGLGQLRTGTTAAATGAGDLATGADGLASGATELGTGLTQGAEQIPSLDADQASQASGVVADPVGLTVERENEIGSPGDAIAAIFVPIGLWLGAFATFLVLRPAARRLLASSAATGRVMGRVLARAALIALAQVVLLVALVHAALGLSLALLPATLGFAAVTAAAFTAIHYLLRQAFGRAGLVVSLILLAIQAAAMGGVIPLQLVAAPFQAISPFLPLTYAASGMQAIIAGGAPGVAWGSAGVLAVFLLLSLAVSYLVTRRSRRAKSLGLVPGTAPSSVAVAV
ncbi:YhgE/Pip domain-containing protein [Clavibacter michiganensis]|uniref:YhgE/Pip domain-containing protein n=1 Tax=Clavibacter michiganensis TaxID=28447 RepID=UPI0026DB28BF|nr:YhgE/Pip domain-containing protein [Clavibacter michiganensis]MDO4131956.1 YhgE/Pip domain-containing protein [Clavibacter michiganensis]MDO4137923.1 YhgE/Pip domain-containing protein [Clavibacter michiganensis]